MSMRRPKAADQEQVALKQDDGSSCGLYCIVIALCRMRKRDPPRPISVVLWRRALTVLLTGEIDRSTSRLDDESRPDIADQCTLIRDLIPLELEETEAVFALIDQVRRVEELPPLLRTHGIRPEFCVQSVLDSLDELEDKVYRMNLVREYLRSIA